MNARLVFVLFFGVVLLAGCTSLIPGIPGTGGENPEASSSKQLSGSYMAAPGTGYAEATESSYETDYSETEKGTSDSASSKGAMEIKEATVQVEVEQGRLEAKLGEAKSILANLNADIISVVYYENNYQKMYALTFKVLPTQFDTALEQLKKIGEVKSVNLNIEDVTKQYTDLNIRLNNKLVELDRLYALYNKSEKVEDMLAIEKEITRVTSDIEVLKSEKETLETKVAKSKITLELYQEVSASEAYEGQINLNVPEGDLDAKISSLKAYTSANSVEIASMTFTETNKEKRYVVKAKMGVSKLDAFVDYVRGLGEVKDMKKEIDEKNRPEKSIFYVTIVGEKSAIQSNLLVPLGELLNVFFAALSTGITIVIGLLGFLIPLAILGYAVYYIYKRFIKKEPPQPLKLGKK